MVVIHNHWLYNMLAGGGLGASPQGCKPAALTFRYFQSISRGAIQLVHGRAHLLLFAHAANGGDIPAPLGGGKIVPAYFNYNVRGSEDGKGAT